jgi:uncharacterized metal-binding protein
VGQLSNQAAVELTREGFGKMFCLAGIGGQLGGFVQSAKDTDHIVVIDGCPVGCAKATLAINGIEAENHVVITDLGIEKNKELTVNPQDVERVKSVIRKGMMDT